MLTNFEEYFGVADESLVEVDSWGRMVVEVFDVVGVASVMGVDGVLEELFLIRTVEPMEDVVNLAEEEEEEGVELPFPLLALLFVGGTKVGLAVRPMDSKISLEGGFLGVLLLEDVDRTLLLLPLVLYPSFRNLEGGRIFFDWDCVE